VLSRWSKRSVELVERVWDGRERGMREGGARQIAKKNRKRKKGKERRGKKERKKEKKEKKGKKRKKKANANLFEHLSSAQ
jgi:hypothetical protein